MTSKSGFLRECRECTNKKKKIYREKNKENIAKKRALYYAENKEEILQNQTYNRKILSKQKTRSTEYKDNPKEYKRKYYQRNKAQVKLASKKYNVEHKEEIAKQRNIRYQLTEISLDYIDNGEKRKTARRLYYEKNKEIMAVKQRNYNKLHPDKYLRSRQKRRSMKKNLPATLTTVQWENIKLSFENKCAYCGSELILTQEHFLPLSKGGEYTKNNIIPACRSCNSSKHNHLFSEWYPSQEFYNIDREKKILSHLGYKKQKQQLSIF